MTSLIIYLFASAAGEHRHFNHYQNLKPNLNHPVDYAATPPLEGNLKLMLKASLQKTSTNFSLEDTNPDHKPVDSRNTSRYRSLPYNPDLQERAKALRKAGNLSEALFWQQIKKCQFKNLDFDRQKIIGNYIVDFYCPNLGLIIEIDGSTHNDKEEYDAVRDLFFESLGLRVIHIEDKEIKKNLNGVMMWLDEHEVFEGLVESQPPRQLRCHPSSGGEFKPLSGKIENDSSAFEVLESQPPRQLRCHPSSGGEFKTPTPQELKPQPQKN